MRVRTVHDLRGVVRGRRLDLGWSQQALADRAGVSRRWVSMFESGHEAAEVGRVLAVIAALGIELEVSAGRYEAPPETPGDVSIPSLRESLRAYDEGGW